MVLVLVYCFLCFLLFLLFSVFLSAFVVWGRKFTIEKCYATRAIVKIGYARKVGDLSCRRK
jgi:hypothetical protein